MALFGALETDPALVAKFIVTIDGLQIPHVTEVSGLSAEVDKVEVKQQLADGKFVIAQAPAQPKAASVTLKRAVTDNKATEDWFKQVMGGDVAGARKTMVIQLLDYMGSMIKQYELRNAMVTKIEWSGMKAGGTEPTIETVSIMAPEVEFK
jgi:phage tail-like protein